MLEEIETLNSLKVNEQAARKKSESPKMRITFGLLLAWWHEWDLHCELRF